jgi:hypothetical protein
MMATGATAQHFPVRWEKVYVFISSTFGDMHAERDYLVKRVFPELQDWCERRRLRLVDIDLRWGVTEADATNKRAVEVCLERINDCRPFFLCFLGQRHGWAPQAADVAASTFTKFPALRDSLGEASVTELEIRHAILEPFTSTDPDPKHAQPQHAEHAFFYFRDAGYLNQLHDAPRQLRCTFTDEVGPEDEGEDERQRRNRAREALRRLREETIPQERPVIYQADWHAELATPELATPLECPSTEEQNIRQWRALWNRFARLGLAETDNRIPADKLDAANAHNAALTRGRLSQFRALAAARGQFPPGTELAQIIQHDLQAAIQTRFPTHTEVAQEDELQKELDQQEGFLLACSEGFIERTGDFDGLDDYVADGSNKLCVLTAPGGMGKSTLLAKWIDRSRSRIAAQPEQSIHFRFIGASDRSTTMNSLVRSLLREIQETTKKLAEEIPADPNKLREALPELLAAVGQRGKTVIVIDALNQLESGLRDLHWLPQSLPPNIKLIVSFKRDDEASEQAYQHFKAAQATLVEVRPFAELEDRRRLVRAYLKQYLKELDEPHVETLIAAAGASNPLYLKVVLSELRVFGAFAGLAEKIRRDFGDNPLSAFAGVLKRLESDPAYSPIEPQRAVSLLFGLLAHARHGLALEELSSLFVQALKLEDNEQGRQVAADTINLLLRQVRPFLARREGRYDYFYESFKLAAQQHCSVSEEEKSADGRSAAQFHQLLGGLFSRQADPSGKRQWDGNSPRALRELPYHLLEGKFNEELFQVARDEVFLTAQERSFPNEPELYLQTSQLAIDGAARIDDAGRIAEFVLAHARQIAQASRELPISALRTGQTERAWKLTDLYEIERCVLWYLLLAWELNSNGRVEEAKETLSRISQRKLVRLPDWQGGFAATLLLHAFEVDEAAFAALLHQLLAPDDLCSLSEHFAARNYFPTALEITQNIADRRNKAKALCAIAAAQAQSRESVSAYKTLADALVYAQQIEYLWDKAEVLSAIAVVQAQTGQATTARDTFASALMAVQQMDTLTEVLNTRQIENQGVETQAEIAALQAQASQFEEALATVRRTKQAPAWFDAPWFKIKALSAIAIAQAQTGEVTTARDTLMKALAIPQQIENSMFRPDPGAVANVQAEVLSAIAIAQAQTGEATTAHDTFASALMAVKQIESKEYKAWALATVATAQFRAGEVVAAQVTLAESLSIAGQISFPLLIVEEALEQIARAQAQASQFAVAPNIAHQIEHWLKRLDPWSKAMALSKIAIAQAKVGEMTAARDTFASALATQQNEQPTARIEMLVEVVAAMAQLGEFAEALAAADLIEDQDARKELLKRVAAARARAGQFAEALAAAQQSRDGFFIEAVLEEIAVAQARLGQVSDAILTARQLKERNTWRGTRAFEEIIVVLARAGQFSDALTTAQEIESPDTLSTIAIAQAQVGECLAARDTLMKALVIAQQVWDPAKKAKVLSTIAIAQAQAGERAAARDSFTSALASAWQAEARRHAPTRIINASTGEVREVRAVDAWMREETAPHLIGVFSEIAVAQAHVGEIEAARDTFASALALALQIESPVNRNHRVNALSEIAVAQARASQGSEALITAQQIQDQRGRIKLLSEIAVAQAKLGQGKKALQTTSLILASRDSLLPDIARALVDVKDKDNFKELLIPCAHYLNAAFRICGLVARLYPEQVPAIAQVVMQESPHKGAAQAGYYINSGLASTPHPAANPERAFQLTQQHLQALARHKALPWWKRLFKKEPQRPEGI